MSFVALVRPPVPPTVCTRTAQGPFRGHRTNGTTRVALSTTEGGQLTEEVTTRLVGETTRTGDRRYLPTTAADLGARATEPAARFTSRYRGPSRFSLARS